MAEGQVHDIGAMCKYCGMNKAALLQALSLEDPYSGFVAQNDSDFWGWNDSPLFDSLILELRPSLVIEVGSWLGMSTFRMSGAMKRAGIVGSLIAIDTWLGSEEHWSTPEGRAALKLRSGYPSFYEHFLSNMKRGGVDDVVLPLPLPSLVASRYLSARNVRANLIYIDGSHNEKDVLDDLEAYWQLLAPGGVIFGDDYQWDSVARAVKTFALSHKLEFQIRGINWIFRKSSEEVATPLTERSDTQRPLAQRGEAYSEPELTFLVLDYHKESEARRCLESIKQFTKIRHKVVYLHNGSDVSYPHALMEEGLIDTLTISRENNGLGIGTRDLFGLSYGEYALYLQNDQFLTSEITEEVWRSITSLMGKEFRSRSDDSVWTVASVDIAGGHWGWHRYNERAHVIRSVFYKEMESQIPLGPYGAGPWHDGCWREEQIQKYYEDHKLLHYTYEHILIADNGVRAVRENKDGSVWDFNKLDGSLTLVHGPVTERFVFPNLTDEEWSKVLDTQSWPTGRVPEREQTKNKKV